MASHSTEQKTIKKHNVRKAGATQTPPTRVRTASLNEKKVTTLTQLKAEKMRARPQKTCAAIASPTPVPSDDKALEIPDPTAGTSRSRHPVRSAFESCLKERLRNLHAANRRDSKRRKCVKIQKKTVPRKAAAPSSPPSTKSEIIFAQAAPLKFEVLRPTVAHMQHGAVARRRSVDKERSSEFSRKCLQNNGSHIRYYRPLNFMGHTLTATTLANATTNELIGEDPEKLLYGNEYESGFRKMFHEVQDNMSRQRIRGRRRGS